MFNFFQQFDQYSDWIFQLISSQVALMPLVLLFVEEAGLPLFVPGDAVLTYAGFKISQTGHTPFWLAVAVAMMAVVAGSTLLFFAARHWGEDLVEVLGRFLFIKPSHIRRGERLFARYGIWAIFFGRHIPGMRVPVTIMAAISNVKYSTFILTTIASTVWWVMAYLALGRKFGGTIQEHIHRYVGSTAVVVVILIMAVVGLHYWRGRRER